LVFLSPSHYFYCYTLAIFPFGKSYINQIIMNKYLSTNVGRLRLLAFCEGISLLALLLIAVPVKYFFANPSLVKSLGPNTLSVGVEENWKFKQTTWKVLFACMIPFGTFYIDHKILRKIQR